jgi:D-alanyl-D-alanine carboxypeptidase
LVVAITAAAALWYGNQIGWDVTQWGLTAASSESEPTPSSTATPNPDPTDPATDPNAVLGHRPYSEAPRSDLKPITADGRIQLRTAAADSYLAMEAAARADGVVLAVISGFRSVEDQQSIFFEVKAQRNQDASQRAEVSAPPGYSEHHTGYAVDLGDANVPATHLSPRFENTAAFRWLEEHAARFNFELSFTRANVQGIAYEPWHWRYVGDRDSLETFYRGSRGQAPPSETDPDVSPNSATQDSEAPEFDRPLDAGSEDRP